MDGAQKVKLALDEIRMLVLGAQVLFGFQLRSAFQEQFDVIPPQSRFLDAVGLLLMSLVVGLLIAPAIYHRVVEDGDATARIQRLIGLLMAAALIPFALAIGINVFVAMERIVASESAALAGLAATAAALWFWFGIELFARRRKHGKVKEMKDERIPLPQKIDQMLTEARVILPGAQALLGFQLSVVLTQSFETLPSASKGVHAAALGLVALCTILLMSPAAYHRIVYGGEASKSLLALGSRFLVAATLALALGLSADIYVVIAKITQSTIIGIAIGGAALLMLLGLWHVSPLLLRAHGEQVDGNMITSGR
jgi:uncharacterized protein DUF6328